MKKAVTDDVMAFLATFSPKYSSMVVKEVLVMKKGMCFMMLAAFLLPGQVFGAVNGDAPRAVSSQASYFGAVADEGSLDVYDEVRLQLFLADVSAEAVNDAQVDLVIWAEDRDNPGFPSSAFVATANGASLPQSPLGEYTYLAANVGNGTDGLGGYFIRSGNYEIYGALADELASGDTVAERVRNTPRLRSTDFSPVVDDQLPRPEPDEDKKPAEPTPQPVQKQTLVFNLPNQSLQKDGQVSKLETAPVVLAGRTYLPFRALGEALGAQVTYYPATGTVVAKLDNRTVTLAVGSEQMMIDALAVSIDAVPFITEGRTMVPLRAAAEAFAFEVTAVTDSNGRLTDILLTK